MRTTTILLVPPSHLRKAMERIQVENRERILVDIDEILVDRPSAPSSVGSSRTDVSGRNNDGLLPSDDVSPASRNESLPSSRHVRFEEEEKEELTPGGKRGIVTEAIVCSVFNDDRIFFISE